MFSTISKGFWTFENFLPWTHGMWWVSRTVSHFLLSHCISLGRFKSKYHWFFVSFLWPLRMTIGYFTCLVKIPTLSVYLLQPSLYVLGTMLCSFTSTNHYARSMSLSYYKWLHQGSGGLNKWPKVTEPVTGRVKIHTLPLFQWAVSERHKPCLLKGHSGL
jgi:hypothetical protein